MFQCQQCKRSVWNIDFLSGLCLECLPKVNRARNEELLKRLPDSPVHCYAVIEGVVRAASRDRAEFGDLFVTSGGLVFTPLTAAKLSGSSRTTTGALIGGVAGAVVGGIADSLADTSHRYDARRLMQPVRADDYCTSVEERIRRHGGVVIPLPELRRAERVSGQSIVRIHHTGGCLELGTRSAQICQDLIQRLQEGSITDQPDPEGVNSDVPGVSQILATFESGERLEELDKEALNRAAADPIYQQRLIVAFKRLKWQQQSAVVRNMIRVPSDLTRVMKDALTLERPKARANYMRVIVVMGLILGGDLWGLIQSLSIDWQSTSMDDRTTLVGMILSILPVLTLAAGIGLVRLARHYRHINAMLESLEELTPLDR